MKEFDFQSGIPSNNDINPNSILLSISGGSLVCTTTTNNFISGINPNFGTNLSTSIVYQIEFDFDPGNMNSSDGLYLIPYDLDEVNNIIYNGALFWSPGTVPAAGHYSYTYTPVYTGSSFSTRIAFNALGSMGSGHYFKVDNVRMCSSLGVITSYSADITSNTDYYPFGQEMPGRTYRAGDAYRYTYNGKESDKEVSSGFQNYGFRVNDTRIGRFFSVDPLRKSYPELTPYQFASNRPIDGVDLDGLEWKNSKGQLLSATQLKAVKVYVFYYVTDANNYGGFETQTKKQVENLVSKYGEEGVAMSALSTENQFAQDWSDMDGKIDIVRINSHGTGQSLFINVPDNEYLTSTGTGSTEVHETPAYNIVDLKQPKGNIHDARLEINTCHSCLENGDRFKGSMNNLAEAFYKKFDFASVRGTASSVGFYSSGNPYPTSSRDVAGWVRGEWEYYRRPLPTLYNDPIKFNPTQFKIMLPDKTNVGSQEGRMRSKFDTQPKYQKQDSPGTKLE